MLVSLALAAWSAVCFLHLRAVERRALGTVTPLTWRTTTVAFASIVYAPIVRDTPMAAAACGATCAGLILGGAVDARTGYLFDAITVPTAVTVAVLVLFENMGREGALGAAMLVGALGSIVVCSRGRLMGFGDVKAAFAIGAAFGPLQSLIAIFAACVSGLLAAAFAGRLRRGSAVRFGPHLATGSVFALVAGDFIVHHIMGL